jgi:hypothetical protein
MLVAGRRRTGMLLLDNIISGQAIASKRLMPIYFKNLLVASEMLIEFYNKQKKDTNREFNAKSSKKRLPGKPLLIFRNFSLENRRGRNFVVLIKPHYAHPLRSSS